MFPLSDDAPRSTTPYVNYLLIALNTIVFLFEVSLTPRQEAAFVAQFAFYPQHVNQWLAGYRPTDVALVPFFSSMFMHAGWLHLILNMWGLAIFGDNVEDRLGHFRYLLFYLICGLGADLAQYLSDVNSPVPSLGASGAIAGVMGAYFILFPKARVLTWPFFFIRLPAWLVLGYWFVLQFLAGAAAAMSYSRHSTGGVAVWAHVGGFISGVLLIKVFPARQHYYYSYEGY
jgi:membrane associated rhomboid family serine protease